MISKTNLDMNVAQDFPVLSQKINGNRLAYLDNAATTQSPSVVIDTLTSYYRQSHANIHRGIHSLSERATSAYNRVRKLVSEFIVANCEDEIVFCSGTTMAINMVVFGYGRQNIKPGSEVILSAMEHHANLVPWQILAKELNLTLKIIPLLADGSLDYVAYCEMFSRKTSFVAVTHVSNVLGTVNPVAAITATAKSHGVPVLIDGAQAIAHMPVDVTAIGCDFYVFSAHKLYGPTGLGILYARAEYLAKMHSYHYGGGMVQEVSYNDSVFLHNTPLKFEAGTQNIASVMALGTAIEYVRAIGLESIYVHEQQLLAYANAALAKIPEVKILGFPQAKTGVISFAVADIHCHDIASLLDEKGVAVRAGHHCAMPLIKSMGHKAVTRASFGIYNNTADVDQLCLAIEYVLEVFA